MFVYICWYVVNVTRALAAVMTQGLLPPLPVDYRVLAQSLNTVLTATVNNRPHHGTLYSFFT